MHGGHGLDTILLRLDRRIGCRLAAQAVAESIDNARGRRQMPTSSLR
jgi:hypothetical protein